MPQIVRWFDHWLKDKDTGMMEEPGYTAFMRESSFTKPDFKGGSGYWVELEKWPLDNISEKKLFLGSEQKLESEIKGEGSDEFSYHVAVGMGNPTWHINVVKGGKEEQEFDERKSLAYTSEPLNERLDIMGRPQLELTFSSTAPIVNLVVKLFDIAPDGSSDIITWSVLNLSHRNSHTEPEPLTPDEKVKLDIEFDATSWIFHPGHMIKISIASSDFPNIWPSPYPAENTVWWGKGHKSCLKLPVIPESDPEEARLFGEIEMPMDVYKINYTPAKSKLSYDFLSATTTFQFNQSQEGSLSEGGISLTFNDNSSFSVSDKNPANAFLKNEHDIQIITRKSNSRAITKALLESDKENFHVSYDLVVTVNDKEKFKRIWSKSFKRNLV